MNNIGPPLEYLMRRLADIPPDFLDEPKLGGAGRIHVDAVVHDLLKDLGLASDPGWLQTFQGGAPGPDRNRLTMTLLFCWLLHDEFFRRAGLGRSDVVALLERNAAELAGQGPAVRFVNDPERREELARTALARCGLRPEGETPAQAADRLTGLNSRERARVLAASREAEKRARAIREQLRKKAAEEAADKWTRE
ncbi:MAG: hypothetical protein V1816_24975 [Pseudomonadota bacterium]